MKVTFPHMGNLYIVLESLFENLGTEVVVPPFCTKRTLELGVLHSPEFACLPLKINVGNFIEALENGADTIVMAGGIGPCRFGYYGEVEREILKDLGFDFKMVIVEPPKNNFLKLVSDIRVLTNRKQNSLKNIVKAAIIAWKKAILLDIANMKLSQIRPKEKIKGQTDKKYKEVIHKIKDIKKEAELDEYKAVMLETFDSIETIKDKTFPRIGIVGEIYTVLEPFVNLDIESELNSLGAEVYRSVYLTDWVRINLFPSFLKPKDYKEMLKLAEPYIKRFIGGHGQETVAQIASFAKNGFDGVIHLLPFTCMPEIVAKSAIPRVAKDYSIPVMTLVLDEHSAKAGVRTRLEAFIDMINQKKEMSEDNSYLSKIYHENSELDNKIVLSNK
ncbi:2-hydroxyacyl-CoA dehydratase [Tepidanaerobacter syntrophicus]|uniref:2-hydroxyacyl-CoA dehydratase n=1 Tax=Tepidanaerobacter syntrophicus TaxID=224999 RepID=UPI001BD1C884|nr:2-hydroxyacyl-CoA dehydratase [Tepidanaerobacter syntrophicus]